MFFFIDNLVKFRAKLTLLNLNLPIIVSNIYMSNGFNFWFNNVHWHFSAFSLRAQSKEKLNMMFLTSIIDYKSSN